MSDVTYNEISLDITGDNSGGVQSIQETISFLTELKSLVTSLKRNSKINIKVTHTDVYKSVFEGDNTTSATERKGNRSERVDIGNDNRGSAWDEVAGQFNQGWLSRGLQSIVEDLNSSTAGLYDNMKGVGSAIGEVAANARMVLGAITKPMVERVRNYAKGFSDLIGSFKRIIMYRIVRSLIKDIGQAFSEGVNNLYQWSKLINGEFMQSMDSIATSALYLKNSLGAMAAPLINALAPAIDFLIDRFVVLLNVINQVLAVLTGAGTWTKAIKYPTEYAKAAGAAAKAAKQLGLAGIDQLTILDKSKNNSGGGSGMDYSKMFETEKLSSIWDDVKKAIEEGDWRGAGKLLAEKLNSIIDQFDAYAFGKSIGEKVNNGIEFAYGFLKELNFRKIGSKIAEFLNGALEQINFETIGRLFTRKFTAMFDLIIGFVETLDWKLIGKKVHDFLLGAFNEFSEWAKEIKWGEFGQEIYQDIKDTVEGLQFGEIAEAMFEALGTAVGVVCKSLDGFFGSAWDDLKKYLDDKMEEAGGNVVKAFFSGILDEITIVGGLEKWLDEHIGDPFEKGIKSVFGIEGDGESKVLDGIGHRLIEGLVNGLLDGMPWFTRNEWVREKFFDPIVGGIKKLFGINSPSKVMYDIGDNIIGGLTNGMINKWTTLRNTIESKWNNLKNWWSNLSLGSFKIPTPHFNVSGSFGWNGSSFSWPSIDVKWYGKGGMPATGEMFIARENGRPEMVGSLNGHSAVANNDQIVEGIRDGVYDAVTSAMASGSFNANVYLDGKQISGVVVKDINNTTRRTGQSPLLAY